MLASLDSKKSPPGFNAYVILASIIALKQYWSVYVAYPDTRRSLSK